MRRPRNPAHPLYQASTSELYGLVQESPQREATPFHPRSPYGVAKLYAYWITVNYREAYGMYDCNGILFNHESARRGETFVTRKITRGMSRIAAGLEPFLNVGTGVDLSIRELADLVAASVGFSGGVEWDTTKPDGTSRQQLDVSRLAALGWQARISLEQGARDTCALLKDSVALEGVPAGLATVKIRET